MKGAFLRIAFRVWLVEVLISGLNYFLLMGLVWQPLFGELAAHQIGMTTRIVYIYGLAYLFLRSNPAYTRRDLIQAGALWLAASLSFEWGGSVLIQGRSVHDILIGWRVWEGYMWPYVLLAYATANYVVGTFVHPGRAAAPDKQVSKPSQPIRPQHLSP